MSRPFLLTVIAILTAGLGYFVWLHYAELRDFDRCHSVRVVRQTDA